MATVLERFNALGLAHSPLILSVIGKHIDIEWHKKYEWKHIPIKRQFENGKYLYVNDYPGHFKKDMDEQIIMMITKRVTLEYRKYLLDFVKRKNK